MAGDTIKVLVVDDHEVVRAGVAAVLSRASDVVVVGEATSAEEALNLLPNLQPDVVVLDHRLPGMSGTVACAEMLHQRPDTAVLALTTFLDDSIIHAFLAAGARGYLLKGTPGPDLVDAVRSVARGECVLAPEVVSRVVEWARRARTIHQEPDSLAPHEVMTLALTARGLTNREIARRLEVSEGTVKLYLRTTMRKLDVSERSQAVAAGIRLGVI